MEFDNLLQENNLKVLLYGKSARGKTRDACVISLTLSAAGYDVLYLDTEAEGSVTMVNLIENGEFEEDDVSNITYERVGDYSDLMDYLDPSVQEKYCLIVVDTMDHKHTYALSEVSAAKMKADVEWNEYAQIYAAEKDMMEMIGDPYCNILCTMDPESGKRDKAKGVQTNIHGYFSVVIEKIKTADGWGGKIENWVGRSELIDTQSPNPEKAVIEAIEKRC